MKSANSGLLSPDAGEYLARARSDLRIGLPVMIGPWLVAPIEVLTPRRLAALRAVGPVQVVLTGRRATALQLEGQGGIVRLLLPDSVDSDDIMALADPVMDAGAFPAAQWQPADAEVLPEARAALALTKSAQLLPAVLMVRSLPQTGLTQLDTMVIEADLAAETILGEVSSAAVPLAQSRFSRLHIYRPEDGGAEHYAIEIGTPPRDQPVLARLHSACFTGDVLGSLKCDCGPQLHAALAAMDKAGSGVLLYLNQEGRGIGLANKMRAYTLQERGFDTVDANHRLGFEDDERDFRIGAALLRQMGFSSVRLMTNNPKKIGMMQQQGIQVVEHVPLITASNPLNEGYLATKASRSGHML